MYFSFYSLPHVQQADWKSDSCFLFIYAKKYFKEAKGVTKRMFNLGSFLYYFRWLSPHVFGEYQHTSVSKFKYIIGKTCQS